MMAKILDWTSNILDLNFWKPVTKQGLGKRNPVALHDSCFFLDDGKKSVPEHYSCLAENLTKTKAATPRTVLLEASVRDLGCSSSMCRRSSPRWDIEQGTAAIYSSLSFFLIQYSSLSNGRCEQNLHGTCSSGESTHHCWKHPIELSIHWKIPVGVW